MWLLGDDRELMERLVGALGPWEIEPGQNCMYQYSVHTDTNSLPWDTGACRVVYRRADMCGSEGGCAHVSVCLGVDTCV